MSDFKVLNEMAKRNMYIRALPDICTISINRDAKDGEITMECDTQTVSNLIDINSEKNLKYAMVLFEINMEEFETVKCELIKKGLLNAEKSK